MLFLYLKTKVSKWSSQNRLKCPPGCPQMLSGEGHTVGGQLGLQYGGGAAHQWGQSHSMSRKLAEPDCSISHPSWGHWPQQRPRDTDARSEAEHRKTSGSFVRGSLEGSRAGPRHVAAQAGPTARHLSKGPYRHVPTFL